MSVNNVLLVGHLGASPELRRTRTGKAVCNFRMATARLAAEGKEAEPDWHRVVTWDRTAELCHQFLRTGRLVAVEGRLTTRSWTDGEGQRRWTTEVVANRVTFLGGRGGEAARDDGGGGPPPPVEEGPGDELPF